ncbi:MAG: hypothetical protein C4531_17395 [Desulfurivibrio sp.]|jgi:hypothetical protein|nr:MAG: hypothetical protein C4531_17395 [Desulfurivibrio sp.]
MIQYNCILYVWAYVKKVCEFGHVSAGALLPATHLGNSPLPASGRHSEKIIVPGLLAERLDNYLTILDILPAAILLTVSLPDTSGLKVWNAGKKFNII